MLRLALKIKKIIWIYGNSFILKKAPVIVFAPGRVGSMALHKNLLGVGVFAFKVESLVNEKRFATTFCKTHIINNINTAKIIVLVRDPVAMMMSYFFSKVQKGWIPTASEASEAQNVFLLQDVFIKDCLLTYRLDEHLYWFENDFTPGLGFSPFNHIFDTVKKNGIIEHPLYPTLIIRTEMDDSVKASLVSSFLQIQPFTLTRENTRSEKADNELYESFKQTLSLPPEILDKIYTSKLCMHFFSADEIKQLRKQWSRN